MRLSRREMTDLVCAIIDAESDRESFALAYENGHNGAPRVLNDEDAKLVADTREQLKRYRELKTKILKAMK